MAEVLACQRDIEDIAAVWREMGGAVPVQTGEDALEKLRRKDEDDGMRR